MVTNNDIRQAIENEDIYLVYQPIMSLKSDRVVAYEALARWKLNNEFISPTVFTRSDDIVLMRSLTQYILKLAQEVEAKLKIPINVNINVSDLQQEINANVSCLEITEYSCEEKFTKAINKLAQNYKIVLDDLGMECGSWIHIPYLPIHKIKLDKIFADELLLEKTFWYQDLVKLIVEMANKYNILVIAEGIETIEQSQLFEELGVHQAQGYLWGQPFKGYTKPR